MSTHQSQRRILLQTAAGLAASQLALSGASAAAGTVTPGIVATSANVVASHAATANVASANAAIATAAGKPLARNWNGKPGEFDFLSGEWKISHRRIDKPGSKEWSVFEGEATCWSILGGIGSIEELRIPVRNFSGMGLRLLDVEKKEWSDFWVNAKSGVLVPPAVIGGFENGVGLFISDETDGGQPIKVRGMWDNITAKTCRWQQAVSRDGGLTWEDNWIMDWKRVR